MRKNWLWYQFFRYPLVRFGLHLFYKRIIIEGKEHLPKNKPILFVPNHQNSFMDALLVVTHTKPFIYFLTRAKAFKPPLLGKFLRSLNMLPVYRVRDGLSSVKKNSAIFDECISYMKRNDAILIFPEANHSLRRSIRPLSKGFTRIAFDAERREDWKMGLHIVPVGLNYSEHRNSRNTVRVVFGEPIVMGGFKEVFEKDEREATELLKSQVSERMKKLVMHPPNMDHYDVHKILLEDLEQDELKLTNPTITNKRIEKIESKLTPDILEVAKKVNSISEKQEISIKSVVGRKKPIFLMILLFPLYLFSWINNLIPYQPVRKITNDIIKDHAFDASIKFLIGLFLFPLFWAAITGILLLFGVPKWIALCYFGMSLITSVMFKNANLIIREMGEKKRLKNFKESNPSMYEEFTTGIHKLNEFRAEVFKN